MTRFEPDETSQLLSFIGRFLGRAPGSAAADPAGTTLTATTSAHRATEVLDWREQDPLSTAMEPKVQVPESQVIVLNPPRGIMKIGRTAFDIETNLQPKTNGQGTSYLWEGSEFAQLSQDGGKCRLIVLTGSNGEQIELLDPPLEVQQAAIALGIAIRSSQRPDRHRLPT